MTWSMKPAGDGIDTVYASISWNLAESGHVKGQVENLTLTGSDNIDGTGNDLDNVLTGNAGNNTLDGGAAMTRSLAARAMTTCWARAAMTSFMAVMATTPGRRRRQ